MHCMNSTSGIYYLENKQIKQMLLASCHVDTAVFWRVLVTEFCFVFLPSVASLADQSSVILNDNTTRGQIAFNEWQLFLFFLFKCYTRNILHMMWELFGGGCLACNSPVAVLLTWRQRELACVQDSHTPKLLFLFLLLAESPLLCKGSFCFWIFALCDVTKVDRQIGNNTCSQPGVGLTLWRSITLKHVSDNRKINMMLPEIWIQEWQNVYAIFELF